MVARHIAKFCPPIELGLCQIDVDRGMTDCGEQMRGDSDPIVAQAQRV
jgi:hypothetical protein